jgi:hypothetical protein
VNDSELIRRVCDVLRINGTRWQALAAGLDRELLARIPEPGEWSALECLNHAEMTEDAVFATRLRVILTTGGSFPDFDPDAHPSNVNEEGDPMALAASHARQRAASLELIAGVTVADLDRTGLHGSLGVVTARQLLNEWAAHDTMHVVQAERAVMQAFIPDAGPWRQFFWDHDVAVKPAARKGH